MSLCPRFARATSLEGIKRGLFKTCFRIGISLKTQKVKEERSADEEAERLKGAGVGADECHFDFSVISVDMSWCLSSMMARSHRHHGKYSSLFGVSRGPYTVI